MIKYEQVLWRKSTSPTSRTNEMTMSQVMGILNYLKGHPRIQEKTYNPKVGTMSIEVLNGSNRIRHDFSGPPEEMKIAYDFMEMVVPVEPSTK